MEIKKKLTPLNYTPMSNKKNKYIVVHYVGAESTAKNNAEYFYNTNTSAIGKPASAHYFVDENDIYQVVEDTNKAWHVKTEIQGKNGHTFLKKCTNSNSIGVELCCKIENNEWYFEDKTVENAAALIRELMAKYNIPITRVIRHFDVTGKNCPAPFIDDEKWAEFKKKIEGEEGMTEAERKKFDELVELVKKLTNAVDELTKTVGKTYHYTEELPDYARPTIQKLLDKGKYAGASESDLNLPEILMRGLVINDRAGVYK